jgi:hypothetical protein
MASQQVAIDKLFSKSSWLKHDSAQKLQDLIVGGDLEAELALALEHAGANTPKDALGNACPLRPAEEIKQAASTCKGALCRCRGCRGCTSRT